MSLPILKIPEENACGCAIAETVSGNGCLCPTTGLVQIIGRKFALRLLVMIGDKSNIRFNELRNAMDEMSSSTLAIRLAELERAGIIDRQTYAETPPRVEYSLTEEGWRLRDSIFSLSRFARKNR